MSNMKEVISWHFYICYVYKYNWVWHIVNKDCDSIYILQYFLNPRLVCAIFVIKLPFQGSEGRKKFLPRYFVTGFVRVRVNSVKFHIHWVCFVDLINRQEHASSKQRTYSISWHRICLFCCFNGITHVKLLSEFIVFLDRVKLSLTVLTVYIWPSLPARCVQDVLLIPGSKTGHLYKIDVKTI